MEQFYVFGILLLTLILFIWGKFRYDIVALLSLFSLVILGIIPTEKAFLGFGHPAVITVAVVLIIGKALERSGLIEILAKWVTKSGTKTSVQLITLCTLVATASAFMNNVGALAIIMPVAITIAQNNNRPNSYYLMPIAFASLLGGMITLIGTPPNIIIASLREAETGAAFSMFDFSPVGIGATALGILFISVFGWRLLPKRTSSYKDGLSFKIQDYITEVIVNKKSIIFGKRINELKEFTKSDVQVLGLVRNNKRIHAPAHTEEFLDGDIIILESDTLSIQTFLTETNTILVGNEPIRRKAEGSSELVIMEAIIMNESILIGRSTSGLRMRSLYGVNLLAVSRKNRSIHNRLDHVVFKAGDVLMLHGKAPDIEEFIKTMECLPLAPRSLRIGFEKNMILTLGIFISSIILIVAEILPVQISFAIAALGIVLSGGLSLKEIYTSIDWPVIVLLGAMLPVGEALQSSGGAESISSLLLEGSDLVPYWMTLGILMAITMMLSAVINNAATVVLMAPIGIGLAKGMGLPVDAFLMTIAIGASAAFLTPIGHQSNTLVLGPGGYRFNDYFRMGVPMSIIILIVATPLVMYFWPA
jgi:di/tricarboxylate transporter